MRLDEIGDLDRYRSPPLIRRALQTLKPYSGEHVLSIYDASAGEYPEEVVDALAMVIDYEMNEESEDDEDVHEKYAHMKVKALMHYHGIV